MNYIRHLNNFFSCIKTEQRLSASHISLYIALFQYWNFNRFHNPFSIYRDDIMQLSKLSKNTYHKCIKELHEAKYIYYHPSASKFKAVRISIIRMDKEEEPATRYKQLDLFSIAPGFDIAPGFSPGKSIKIDTGSVSNSIPSSPNFKTGTVANLGHLIKANNKQVNVCNTPTEIFKRNEKIQKAVNQLAQVPKSVHSPDRHPELVSGSIPQLSEVESFFKANNYPDEEAKKFFHYNNGKNWMLTDKLPIKNWESIAHKWMLNNGGKSLLLQEKGFRDEVQYLYDCFLENKKIFHHITTTHYDQLQLSLTNETQQQAWHERIKQVSGTNQHSLNQIWQAYLTNDPTNQLVKKDEPNLIALAKRIEVFKHFQQCKQRNFAVVAVLTNNSPPPSS